MSAPSARSPFSLFDAIYLECRQEPGTNDEIKEFVKKFNVTFPLFDKVNVNGPQAHPLFKWLKDEYVSTRPHHAHWLVLHWAHLTFAVRLSVRPYVHTV